MKAEELSAKQLAALSVTYREPFDLLTEGLSFRGCGADDVVTRTLERVIQGFREALESRNELDSNGLTSDELKGLARDMDVWSLLTASPGRTDPHTCSSVS